MKWIKFSALVFLLFMVPSKASAMHIMEGFLPVKWAVFWWAAVLPFLVYGLRSMKKIVEQDPQYKMMLGLSGAFAFVLSALKIPSVTGSCSHPTGVGFGTILFGPGVMTVMGFIVLLFQSLLLAHGGLTTLGANAFSMAVVGPMVTYMIFKGCQTINLSFGLRVFFAAMLGDLCTYVMTSFQLALAFPAEVGGFMAALVKFMSIFAVTQIPLAISEGLLTVFVINLLKNSHAAELKRLHVLKGEKTA